MAMPAAGGDIRTVVRNIFDSDDKQLKTYTEFGKVYNIDIDIIFGLANMGIIKDSLLQKEVLPKLLDDKHNLAIIYPTGTGKTLTAAIAAVNYVDTCKSEPQVLYLCATLESAVQTYAFMCRITDLNTIKIGLVVKNETAILAGKQDYHILVGTPKEVAGFSMFFDVKNFSLCIFDDADEVYTTNIVKKHIANRLQHCRKVLISSTSLNAIMDGSYRKISTEIPSNSKQFFIKVDDSVDKLQAIVNVYKSLMNSDAKAIVFCNTRQSFEIVHDILSLKRLEMVTVSGKSSTEERRKLFDEFLNGKTPLAICTDIWSRGLDIPSVKIVINFEIPRNSVSKALDKKTYVYRIGRAARFGHKGIVITLVDQFDEDLLVDLRETHLIDKMTI